MTAEVLHGRTYYITDGRAVEAIRAANVTDAFEDATRIFGTPDVWEAR